MIDMVIPAVRSVVLAKEFLNLLPPFITLKVGDALQISVQVVRLPSPLFQKFLFLIFLSVICLKNWMENSLSVIN